MVLTNIPTIGQNRILAYKHIFTIRPTINRTWKSCLNRRLHGLQTLTLEKLSFDERYI